MTNSKAASGRSRARAENSAHTSLLETIATIISGLLVLATITFLIYESTQSNKPPEFEVKVQKSRMSGGFHYLPVEVHNHGHQAAQSLQIRVTLESETTGTQPVEVTAQLQWLPGRSSRDVVCVFRENPADYTKISARVEGYEVP